MTTNLKSRYNIKWRGTSNLRTRELEVEDFDSAFPEIELLKVVAGIEQGPMPPDLDIEVEVSGMPKPKHTRMTTLKVESRGRAKFESGPLDFYANV